jgi:hypothetical protein
VAARSVDCGKVALRKFHAGLLAKPDKLFQQVETSPRPLRDG